MLTFYDLYIQQKKSVIHSVLITLSSVSKKLSKIVFLKDFIQVFLKFM